MLIFDLFLKLKLCLRDVGDQQKQIQNTRKFQESLQQVSEICFSAFLASPWIVSKTFFKASHNLDKVHVNNMYAHLWFQTPHNF